MKKSNIYNLYKIATRSNRYSYADLFLNKFLLINGCF